MPTQERADAVLRALAGGQALSISALETRVDIRRSQLELLLKVMAVDGSVVKVRDGWQATGKPWVHDTERYERISQARREEQQAMLGYERSRTCRMTLLTGQLDDPSTTPCGRCDVCAGPWYSVEVDQSAAVRAVQSLNRVAVSYTHL